jgi:hypothetical protein
MNIVSLAKAVCFLLPLGAAPASAAVFPFNFSGSTTGVIADPGNIFGLGITIAPGADYALDLVVDSAKAFVTQIGSSGVDAKSQCCEPLGPSQTLLPGLSHIVEVTLTINGTALTIDTSQFERHTTRLLDLNQRAGPGGSIADREASIVGNNALGSNIDLSFDSRTEITPVNPDGPQQTTKSLQGSIALALLAEDGSPSVTLSAENAFGLTTEQVPIPAALPLLGAGLVGLGILSRRRKSLNG